ncbi:hypothetical protein HGRIS_013140 [Hohenbuehelia grisea]|uniref:DNA primase large subunit n=1 Tax=Hohenbuehelia grisea TaxID=104357 RepID=A0ABR3IUV2_9AGAR
MFKAGNKAQTTSDLPQYGLEYPHRLNFYDRPPLFDVTLEEFEVAALDRLRILAEIESSGARNRSWDETKDVTNKQCDKFMPLHSNTAIHVDRDSERKRDVLGHFVLRLAFCRSDELRRRFVKAESTLFRIRYDGQSQVEREAFLQSRDFDWIAVSDAEKEQHSKELYDAYLVSGSYQVNKADREFNFKSEKFYKVRWTRVPDLIERRKVFLKAGWAYVPSREHSSIVFQEFEVCLQKALELTAKALPRLDEDTRLVPILSNLSQGFLAGMSSEWTSGTENGEDIRAEMVDELARKHYPMCMRYMHDNLRRDKHLKHFGRLQYGLFLKVLGLSIEEAIIFWRKSFSGKTDDEFNKQYKYNIRHSYGLEGKGVSYPARSCTQILMPTDKAEYVCPYKLFTPENLQTALLKSYSSQGLTSNDLPEVLNIVKAGHPHVACTRVFEITHASCGVKKGEGVGDGESVTHPNQYAALSIELEKTHREEDFDAMAIG